MHELSPDSGNVVLAKDKNIGYLAQYQDIHGHHTIYEELISTKQHIIDMENRLRSLEQEMKTTTGDALDSLMNTYTRLSHQLNWKRIRIQKRDHGRIKRSWLYRRCFRTPD